MTEKTDLERARGIAVQLENENRRLEDELADSRRVAEFYMQENGKNLAAISRGRAECDVIEQDAVRRDLDCECEAVGLREAVRRLRAVLDSGEQPSPDGDRLILDGRTLPVLSHWREQGPTSDGREKWGVVTQQPGPAAEESPS